MAHLTPGHTKGCTTWTLQVPDGGRTLNAVIIGSPNVNPGYVLVGNTNYPQIAEDYVKTFAVLKALPCDLFLGAHGALFRAGGEVSEAECGRPEPVHRPGRLQGLCRRTGSGISEGMGAPESA